MISAVSILVFLSAFFSARYTEKFLFKEEDPLDLRFRRLVCSEEKANHGLLVAKNESASLKRLKEQLARSGLYRKQDLEHAIRMRRLSTLIPFGLAIVLFFMGFPMPQVAASTILFAVIFIVMPRLWLFRSIFKRRREIERHLPDALDLLILCLEAGLSFDSALVRVAEEERRVCTQLSREFIFTNQEILAGQSREEALRHLALRTGVDDMKNLVSAVQQSIKLGTSLVKTLKMQADVIRKKRRDRLRSVILKTPVKLIFPLLLCIFPTLMILILAPSLTNIFRHFSAVGY